MFVTTLNLNCTKINARFKKFIACLWEGLIHKWKHMFLAPYVGIQLPALFHKLPVLTSLVYSNAASTITCIFSPPHTHTHTTCIASIFMT